MPQRTRQTVGVVLELIGRQDVSTAAHHAQTESAAVSVRIGKALIYMHDARTVQGFLRVWEELAVKAAHYLPQNFTGGGMAPPPGMQEPGVLINATSAPASLGRVMRRPGEPSYVQVGFGRLLIHVRDHAAFASTVMALRQAASLAEQCFPATEESRREQALRSASRAMSGQRASGRHAGTQAARTGREWPPKRVPAARRPAPQRPVTESAERKAQ